MICVKEIQQARDININIYLGSLIIVYSFLKAKEAVSM